MVEEATVADDQKVQVPTRRSRIQGTQLLQNAMLQYVSYTVFDTIEKGTICRDDFPKAILGKRAGEYNPSKAFFEACVVFADASGFTALTEALAKQPHG